MEASELTAYVTIFGALVGVSIIYLRFYVGRELTGAATSIRNEMASGFEKLRSDLRSDVEGFRRDVMTREVVEGRLESIERRMDRVERAADRELGGDG